MYCQECELRINLIISIVITTVGSIYGIKALTGVWAVSAMFF